MKHKQHSNGVTEMNLTERLDLAKALADGDRLDEAEQLVEQVEKVLKAAQAAEDDDGDDGDEMMDDDEEDDDGDADEVDDEDDGDDDMTKSLPRYPHDDLTPAFVDHQNATTPVSRVHRRDKFESKVDQVMLRDKVNRSAAYTIARRENPADFDAFQNNMSRSQFAKLGLPKTPPLYPESDDQQLQASGRKKKKQHLQNRARHHDQQVKTHEDEVGKLVAVGHAPAVAKTIVQEQFGNTLPHRTDAMAKACDTVVTRFMKRCDQIMRRDGVDRTTAMAKARVKHPEEFALFQLV